MTTSGKKIIIEGVTESGERFRPSDWAERLSGRAAHTQHRRLVYSPMLQPSYKDGSKCVILDMALEKSNPKLYHSILAFAKLNRLKMWEMTDDAAEPE